MRAWCLHRWEHQYKYIHNKLLGIIPCGETYWFRAKCKWCSKTKDIKVSRVTYANMPPLKDEDWSWFVGG